MNLLFNRILKQQFIRKNWTLQCNVALCTIVRHSFENRSSAA